MEDMFSITKDYNMSYAKDSLGQGGTDMASVSTQGGSSSYAGYASIATALVGVVQGEMQTRAFKAELTAATDAAVQNVGNAVTSFELQQVQSKENIANINHVLGDKLSARGLDAMKEAAMLKVAAAETGTSGGTTAMAVKEAFINENMDKANIVAGARQQRRAILSAMDVNLVGIQNQIDSQLLGGTSVTTNPLLAGIAGGLSNATQVLDMIPMSERVKAFGIEPTGGNA